MRYILAFLLGLALAWGIMHKAKAQDTNPPEVQRWFQELRSHAGFPCCGEDDGYPAAIDIMATPTHEGTGHIIDPAAKEIWVKGVKIKTRPKREGNLNFTFTWQQITKEENGNPFGYAYVFVSPYVHDNLMVYCLAPLPNIY